MENNPITIFAEANYRNKRRRFGIKLDDRRRHMYIVGKTGMGKSTMIENMVINDIQQGHGLALIDPHGDLVEKVVGFIPPKRINDVIYFNPSDFDFPIAFNILESVGSEYRHLIAYGLVGVFKKIWADSWGPRMEYILTNAILALLEYPGSTLLGIMRILVDKKFRKKVVARVTDPVVRTFWTEEFSNYSEKFRTEAIAPIQNKVGQFLASSIIRNIVGQSKSTVNMREIMDQGKILLVNLSKGRIGEENSALLGSMIITKLQLAAMSRVDIPEPDRKDFFLYVDEFQNFATESFANILSEARKYRLDIIVAHQYIEQLGDEVKAAVFGNIGTMISFRVGGGDAVELVKEFGPAYNEVDVVNISKHNFFIRLMIDGIASTPFTAIGLPPLIGGDPTAQDKVIRVSRERYARTRQLVEDKILRWSGVEIAGKNNTDSADKNTDNTGEEEEDDDFEETGKETRKDNKPLQKQVIQPPAKNQGRVSGDFLIRRGKMPQQNMPVQQPRKTEQQKATTSSVKPEIGQEVKPGVKQEIKAEVKNENKPRFKAPNFLQEQKIELDDVKLETRIKVEKLADKIVEERKQVLKPQMQKPQGQKQQFKASNQIKNQPNNSVTKVSLNGFLE